jgi:hypothetical protein
MVSSIFVFPGSDALAIRGFDWASIPPQLILAWPHTAHPPVLLVREQRSTDTDHGHVHEQSIQSASGPREFGLSLASSMRRLLCVHVIAVGE